MLFDPKVLVEHPFATLFMILVIVLCNSFVAGFWVRRKGYRLIDAATVGLSVAQVGEFSFILSGLGVSMGLVGQEELLLIVAAGLITIALNSVAFAGLRPFMKKYFPEFSHKAEQEGGSDSGDENVRNRILIVGAGLTGRELFKMFKGSAFDVYIIEKRTDRSMQNELGDHFIFGDASHPLVLSRLSLDKTRWVLNTSSEALVSRNVADQVAKIDPEVKVLALADKEGDRDFFMSGAAEVDPNISALIETRCEIARSIFNRLQQEENFKEDDAGLSAKKIKNTAE